MYSKTLSFFLLTLLILLFTTQITTNTAIAQIVKGEPIGSITLSPLGIFEVGIKMKAGASIKYDFNADEILLFVIHSHKGGQVTNYSAMESNIFDGVFIAPIEGDYYFLCQNLRTSEAVLKYSIFIDPEKQIIQYEEIQYDIITLSNSNIEILNFSQEDKQILIRIQTPYLTPGFANITIPRNLLDGPFNLQGTLTEHRYTQNNSSSVVTLGTPNGTHDVSIIGTTVVPEIPSPMIFLALAFTSILLVVKIKMKKFF